MHSFTRRALSRIFRRWAAVSGSAETLPISTLALASTSSSGRAISLFTASIDCDAVHSCWALNRSRVCRAAAISRLNSSVNWRSSGPNPLGRGLSTLSVPITSSWTFSGIVIELRAPSAPRMYRGSAAVSAHR